MRRYILLLVFFKSGLGIYGQVIQGTVYDDQTKMAIEFASVYFNGSFTGTTTDMSGHFELDMSKNRSMPLTISAIGYYSLTLTEFDKRKPLLIYLSPQIYDIKALEISGKSYTKERRRYLRFFKNEFIGRSLNARYCKILNEKDITFNYENAEDTLKAFALKPLQIENTALGYRLTYYLDLFEYYTKSHVLFFAGNIIFNEDLSNDPLTGDLYLNKREKVFPGSRMHFFRSLWADQLKENDYQIKNLAGDELKPIEFIVQEEDKKYLTYSEPLVVYHDIYYSRIQFLKERILFDHDGYFDPSGIRWEGAMAKLRIADWLPYEYLYELNMGKTP